MELLPFCAVVVEPGFKQHLQADDIVLYSLHLNVHAQDCHICRKKKKKIGEKAPIFSAIEKISLVSHPQQILNFIVEGADKCGGM